MPNAPKQPAEPKTPTPKPSQPGGPPSNPNKWQKSSPITRSPAPKSKSAPTKK